MCAVEKENWANDYCAVDEDIVAGCDEFPPKVASYAEEGGL